MGHEIFFIAAKDRFAKFPTACKFEKANVPNVLKFLDMYIDYPVIPRSIRLDQAECLLGHQVKTLCYKKIIENSEAPVNDDRAIGLVERLIETVGIDLQVSKRKTRLLIRST